MFVEHVDAKPEVGAKSNWIFVQYRSFRLLVSLGLLLLSVAVFE